MALEVAEMNRKTQHVVPNSDGGWSVKRGGSTRATRNFDVKKKAESFGRAIAKKQGAELIIHKKDGTIQNSNSFGKDPCPPKDKVR